MNLQKYIGKLFIHTKKAIRKGHPNFRLYCVAKVETDPDGDPTQFLCAWKVDRKTATHFWHPAFCQPPDAQFTGGLIPNEHLPKYNLCISEKLVTTRSTPTATFIPDSYYKEVILEEAIKELVPVR